MRHNLYNQINKRNKNTNKILAVTNQNYVSTNFIIIIIIIIIIIK